MPNNRSAELYVQLLDYSKARLNDSLKKYATFPSQLSFDKIFNSNCMSAMYDEQRNKKTFLPKASLWPKICGLMETCDACKNFYLAQRSNLDKFRDIALGQQFENEFMGFLNSMGIIAKRADNKKKNAPDIQVVKNSSIVCFLEMKYLSAPFVLRNKFDKDRECYEGSTTLDSDQKILAQRSIVENEIESPVYYVYWLDYPCIKGIFFMESTDVYKYLDSVNNLEWTRKQRSGDFVGQFKVGHSEKVYLPLLKMGNFEELMGNLV